ncbi:MAG: hypothetical protein K2X44_11990, partial [Magnetospirillum sp.]|nr:hypothetical protein [Magnetospirillum sp.]
KGRIWIYGTGEGGQRVAAELERRSQVKAAGFIDDFRCGHLGGIPISSRDAAGAQMTPEDKVILATQHWAQIWPRLASLPAQRLYTAHPHYGAEMVALPQWERQG